MSDPQISTANYAAVIADLEAKRADLDRTIAMLKAMSQVGGNPPVLASAPPASAAKRTALLPTLQLAGTYGSNNSIGEACVRILQAHDGVAPLTTRQVTDLLAECGFEVKTTNPVNNVWSALDNRSKTKKDVRKDGTGWRYVGAKGAEANGNRLGDQISN